MGMRRRVEEREAELKRREFKSEARSPNSEGRSRPEIRNPNSAAKHAPGNRRKRVAGMNAGWEKPWR